MKFTVNKIHLWLNENNEHIELIFKPNKVNVLTGGSNTGKTSLLNIVDYCLFAKKNDIPDDVNELAFAYGITLTINDKVIVIIRETNGEHGKNSANYLFLTDIKDFPKLLRPEIFSNYSVKERVIKVFLEKEFSITENFELLPSGNRIRKGSTLNLSYFFLFNTISQNIIINKNDFFDFQINKRDRELYSQALDSIFDLSIGLSSEANYKLRQQISELESELRKVNEKKDKQNKKLKKETDFVNKLIFKAKEFDLIDDEIDPNNVEEAFSVIKKRINLEYQEITKSVVPPNYKELENKAYVLRQKIRTLNGFKAEISKYHEIITEEEETILPFKYLEERQFELINLPEVSDYLSNLKTELETIRKSAKSAEPIKYNADEEILQLQQDLNTLQTELNKYPKNKQFISSNQKSIFLIEARKDISHFLGDKKTFVQEVEDFELEIKFYKQKIDELSEMLPQDITETKRKRIELLNELIQSYLDEVKDCLDNYQDYKATFNYNSKILELRRPFEDKPVSIDGVSNYLFLQISLFLGLHELFIKQGEKNYIPQFLIIDYPSLPYKSGNKEVDETETISNDDRNKLRKLFELLNGFISKVNEYFKTDFQIIILEHVEPDIWEEGTRLSNFHLVDEFRNGRKLLNMNKIK